MLKYLFTATFKDGTIYEQTAEDKSQLDPEKRSCYYDVVQMQKPTYKEGTDEIISFENPLVAFVLKGEGHEYGVDLRDGHFEIDGVQFNMHEGHHIDRLPNGRQVAYPLKDYRLIFFRQHTHSFNVTVKDGNHKETEHKIVYRMGWQCSVNGKNYQEVMQFK